MAQGFVDVHHHLLYGLDADGPQTREEMTAMIQRAAAEGITVLIATPHVVPGIRFFDAALYQERLAEAREYCESAGICLTILPGAELWYTDFTCSMLQEGRVPALADTRHVLVEFRPDIQFAELEAALRRIAQSGFLPLLAHVERYGCLVRKPSRLQTLKESLPVNFQVNCAALYDSQGWLMRRFLRFALRHALVDAIATDAHNTTSRAADMQRAYRWLENENRIFQQRLLFDGSKPADQFSEEGSTDLTG